MRTFSEFCESNHHNWLNNHWNRAINTSQDALSPENVWAYTHRAMNDIRSVRSHLVVHQGTTPELGGLVRHAEQAEKHMDAIRAKLQSIHNPNYDQPAFQNLPPHDGPGNAMFRSP